MTQEERIQLLEKKVELLTQYCDKLFEAAQATQNFMQGATTTHALLTAGIRNLTDIVGMPVGVQVEDQ